MENEDICKKIVQRQKDRRKREKRIKIVVLACVLVVFLAAAAGTIVYKMQGSKSNNTGSNKTAVKEETAKKEQEKNTEEETEAADNDLFEKPVYFKKSATYQDMLSPEVLSPYVALADVNKNEIIAGKSYDTRIFPASMTKVMTLIVIVENLKSLDETFEMTAEIIDPLARQQASRAGFEPGEVVSAKDMLYGLVLASGADCSVGLSELVCGSENGIVDLMNKKCKEMGLKNTHFMNTSGLHDENHYTTPLEMAMILKYAMSNETCAEILSTYQYTTAANEIHPEGILLTSTMFSRMYGDEVNTVKIISGKTGYTMEAGNCLVSYAERGQDKYIAVTAGASNRWNVIFDDFYIYGNYIPNPPGYSKNGNVQTDTAQEDVNAE